MQTAFKFTLGLLALVFSLSGHTQDQAGNRGFQQIIDSGQIRVGVALFEPWVMRGKNNRLIGSEPDIARRLADDMGVQAEFRVYDWEKLIPALEKGEIDIIIAGMAIKPERALRVYFSAPYGSSGVGLAANSKLTTGFSSFADLQKPAVKIGALKNTAAASVAERVFPQTTITLFKTEAEAEQALLADKLAALVAFNPRPKFLALQHPGKVDVPLGKPLMSFKEAFAIRRGEHDLLNFLNAWIAVRQADHWLDSTHLYWFDSLQWQDQSP